MIKEILSNSFYLSINKGEVNPPSYIEKEVISNTFYLNINKITNRPPTITNLDYSLSERDCTITFDIHDEDNDQMNVYLIKNNQEELILSNQLSGSKTITLYNLPNGVTTLSLRVSDGSLDCRSETISIEIKEVVQNRPPVITNLKHSLSGKNCTITFNVHDEDNDQLNIYLTRNSKEELVLRDHLSGNKTITVNNLSVGSHIMSLRVSDGKLNTYSDTFRVTVEEEIINNPPTISNVQVNKTNSVGVYELEFEIQDVDNDKMDVYLKVGDSNYEPILVNQSNGVKQYKGQGLSAGNHTCFIKVSDGKQEVISNSFNIRIPQTSNDNMFESIELITPSIIKANTPTRVAIKLKSKANIDKKIIHPKIKDIGNKVKIYNAQWEKGNVLTDWRESVSEISSKTSELSVNLEGIKGTVEKIEGSYVTQSEMNLTSEKLELKFLEGGAYNLLYNGDFKRGGECWSNLNSRISFPQNGLTCPNGRGVKLTGVIGETTQINQYDIEIGSSFESITVSYYTYVGSGTDGTTNPYRQGELTIKYTDDTYSWHGMPHVEEFDVWEKKTITIKPSKRIKSISMGLYNRDTTRTVYYSAVMVERGELAHEWCPNPNEVYDGITTIDKDGVTVTASNVKSKTNMSANGFKITKTDTNEDVFKVNADGTLYMKGSVTVTSGNAKDMVDRVVGWTYSGTTEINGGNIRTGTLSASKITAGTLDASKVTVTNLNASNIKSGKLSANYIDATNLSVKGELLSGQINGIGGMKFADGAIISSYDSHVSGYKGIQISAPSIKLGDMVNIYSPTLIGTVTGKSSSSSSSSSWTMSNAGALTCASASLSKTLGVSGQANIGSVVTNRIDVYGNSNLDGTVYMSGACTVASELNVKNKAIYGMGNIALARGTVYLPQGGGNNTTDYLRIGGGFIAGVSSGNFHFLTSNGSASRLYASNVSTSYSLASVASLPQTADYKEHSVFDEINSVNVIETEEGLRLLDNPVASASADSVGNTSKAVYTTYNEKTEQEEVNIDYTTAISTLWKAVQELKQENDELKEIIKDIHSKL